MSQTNPSSHSPRWVRCAVCVLIAGSFPLLCTCIALGTTHPTAICGLPICGCFSMHGLYTLTHGRCKPPSWPIVLRVIEAILSNFKNK